MNKEEYKNISDKEYKKFKYTLGRNACIAVLGLAMSAELFAYNQAIIRDTVEQSKKETVITEKTFKDAVSTLNRIQNMMLGIGGASGLYLLLGGGIPLVKYVRKKKSLEKQL